ncbi:MAG: hypothetical protein CMJ78_26175 [Planctomycetaceae bacterium]|nr:hypothetical protein [Planctomycetaceae bacterium]
MTAVESSIDQPFEVSLIIEWTPVAGPTLIDRDATVVKNVNILLDTRDVERRTTLLRIWKCPHLNLSRSLFTFQFESVPDSSTLEF